MISSVQRQCNGINLTRQHTFFTFSRLTLLYQFHDDSWLIPLKILKRIAVKNRLSIWLIITESERKPNFLSVSTGGLKKLVTLPLCRFHKCHEAVFYVTQHNNNDNNKYIQYYHFVQVLPIKITIINS